MLVCPSVQHVQPRQSHPQRMIRTGVCNSTGLPRALVACHAPRTAAPVRAAGRCGAAPGTPPPSCCPAAGYPAAAAAAASRTLSTDKQDPLSCTHACKRSDVRVSMRTSSVVGTALRARWYHPARYARAPTGQECLLHWPSNTFDMCRVTRMLLGFPLDRHARTQPSNRWKDTACKGDPWVGWLTTSIPTRPMKSYSCALSASTPPISCTCCAPSSTRQTTHQRRTRAPLTYWRPLHAAKRGNI